jgi:hypothetical protein
VRQQRRPHRELDHDRNESLVVVSQKHFCLPGVTFLACGAPKHLRDLGAM